MGESAQVGGRSTGPLILHNAAVVTAPSAAQDVSVPGGGVYTHILLQVTGTFVASTVLQGTVDGTNYVTIEVESVGATGTRLTAMTVTGVYRGNISGFKKVRTSMTWTSGTSITIYGNLGFGGQITPPATTTVGVGATDLGKAEDAVHASGDTGVMSLAVRRDAAATTATTDGDYAAFTLDATGRLWVHVDAITAGETHVGEVSLPNTVVTVTPVIDTALYTTGDVLFDSTAITAAARVSGGTVTLDSIVMVDKADQTACTFDLWFFDRTVSFGAANAVIGTLSDADGLFCIGRVNVPAANFVDLGGLKIATVANINFPMKSNATSIFVAATVTGAPTYAATTDIQIKFGFTNRS